METAERETRMTEKKVYGRSDGMGGSTASFTFRPFSRTINADNSLFRGVRGLEASAARPSEGANAKPRMAFRSRTFVTAQPAAS